MNGSKTEASIKFDVRGQVNKSSQNVPDGVQNIKRNIFLKNAIS